MILMVSRLPQTVALPLLTSPSVAGLSHAETEPTTKPQSVPNLNTNVPILHLEKTITDSKPSLNDTPFTIEELEAAMTRATLKPHTEHTVDNRVSVAA